MKYELVNLWKKFVKQWKEDESHWDNLGSSAARMHDYSFEDFIKWLEEDL